MMLIDEHHTVACVNCSDSQVLNARAVIARHRNLNLPAPDGIARLCDATPTTMFAAEAA
jgi:hypothetical protein